MGLSADADWRRVLADIGRSKTRLGRRRLGQFCIEGTRLHERAMRGGVAVESALAARAYAQNSSQRIRSLMSDLRDRGCRLHVVPDEVLAELTAGRDLGAIVGLVPIPETPCLAAVLENARHKPVVVLAAIDVEDPGNVGALVRTGLAGRANAFAAVGISDAYHPRAVRISMGSVFRLPILVHENLDRLITDFRACGVQAVGAVSRGGEPLHEARFDSRAVAVLMGSEAEGLDEEMRSASDRLISVAMPADVDSFSVNAAAAVILYEIRRPR